MKKMGSFHRGLTFLALVSVLTLGLMMIVPPSELYAATDDEKPATTEQTDGEAGASEQTDGTAGASEQKFEHYKPLPVEPIHREANNVLLGSGLAVAALTIGGAVVMDNRKRK